MSLRLRCALLLRRISIGKSSRAGRKSWPPVNAVACVCVRYRMIGVDARFMFSLLYSVNSSMLIPNTRASFFAVARFGLRSPVSIFCTALRLKSASRASSFCVQFRASRSRRTSPRTPPGTGRAAHTSFRASVAARANSASSARDGVDGVRGAAVD